ncbi:hypothetical protein, conserved [Leishmania tarentolae]|uniref:Uncharacterized protein n=1 Tax=Leishmania tarentolae TaxID=5689 RepID=A0A640KQR3_LEITA|nr:hypothetical protein, conserved [Leishmania tarentolae]
MPHDSALKGESSAHAPHAPGALMCCIALLLCPLRCACVCGSLSIFSSPTFSATLTVLAFILNSLFSCSDLCSHQVLVAEGDCVSHRGLRRTQAGRLLECAVTQRTLDWLANGVLLPFPFPWSFSRLTASGTNTLLHGCVIDVSSLHTFAQTFSLFVSPSLGTCRFAEEAHAKLVGTGPFTPSRSFSLLLHHVKMPIKAKVVDKSRAAAFDRGRFSVSSGAHADWRKQSYYYEGDRRGTGADTRSHSSSSTSSVSSSRSLSLSPYNVGSQCRAACPQLNFGSSEGDCDMSDDEEVVRRARAATRALLGSSRPGGAAALNTTSCEGGGPATPPNARLERYLRGRASSMLPVKQVGPVTSALDPNSRATTAWGTSISAEQEFSPPPNEHQHENHESKALPTTNDICGAARDATIASDTVSSAVERALQWNTTNLEFQHLMTLLAQDVQRERCDDLPPSSISVASAFAEGEGSDSLPPYLTTRPTSTRTYAPPSRTFAALEDNALEQLYEDWCLQRGEVDEGDEGAVDGSGHTDDIVHDVFIAADHRAAAFSIAASAAHQRVSAPLHHEATATSVGGTGIFTHRVSDAPFTWEELLRGEVARRNTRHGSAYSPGDGVMLSDPASLAYHATRRLQRFFQSVACVERVVRDKRFMHSVAVFLYEHHKVFLPHYRPPATSSKAAKASTAEYRDEDVHADIAAHSDVEHTHIEHRVYEEFGERVSTALLSVLFRHVPGFDEAEFVEALYETPPTYSMMKDAGAAAGDQAMLGCLQNVLSFPAWRLLLAVSGFESFFLWMMDYIYEEYYLDRGSEEDGSSVAVAGVRGLRALIRSTYSRRAAVRSADTLADEAEISASVPGGSEQQETVLHTLHPPVPDNVTASVASHPASEPHHPSLQLSPLLTRLSHTPSPPDTTASPLVTSLLSSGRGSGEPLRKFFPTPPASADGVSRGLKGTGVAPYRKRKTTNPGRDLPPITPGSSTMMSGSGIMTATFSDLSSSTSGVASSPLERQSEKNLGQPPGAALAHTSTSSDYALDEWAGSVAPKTLTAVTAHIAEASPRQSGGSAPSKFLSSSTTRTKTGTAQKTKPKNRRLNR